MSGWEQHHSLVENSAPYRPGWDYVSRYIIRQWHDGHSGDPNPHLLKVSRPISSLDETKPDPSNCATIHIFRNFWNTEEIQLTKAMVTNLLKLPLQNGLPCANDMALFLLTANKTQQRYCPKLGVMNLTTHLTLYAVSSFFSRAVLRKKTQFTLHWIFAI